MQKLIGMDIFNPEGGNFILQLDALFHSDFKVYGVNCMVQSKTENWMGANSTTLSVVKHCSSDAYRKSYQHGILDEIDLLQIYFR